MSNFESSAFGKKQISGTGMREFSVGEPEENNDWMNEMDFQRSQQRPTVDFNKQQEEEIKKARLAKQKGTLGVTEFAKQRIEFLTNLGRQYVEVKIEKMVFLLRTLKAKEIKESFEHASQKYTNALEISVEMRRQQLARSLCKIDGQELAVALGSDTLETVLYVLDNLEEGVYDLLVSEMEKLRTKVQEQFSVKDQVVMKEVLEDLKK